MSVSALLIAVTADTAGAETSIRIIGTRDPPAKMVIQIAITGTASVQIQGRIARNAPWADVGAAHAKSTLMHIEPVPFLRAVSKDMAADSTVSVWAIWAW